MSHAPSLERQVAFLACVPLLRQFDAPLLAALAGVMTLERVPAGALLCEEGSEGTSCFILGHGNVEVFKGIGEHRSLLGTLGAGNAVGEVALIDGRRRSASVRCVTDVTVFELRREDFERLLYAGNHASMRLLDNIAVSLAKRLRDVNNRYNDIFSNQGETIAKLAKQLSELQATICVGDVDLDEIEVSQSRPELSP